MCLSFRKTQWGQLCRLKLKEVGAFRYDTEKASYIYSTAKLYRVFRESKYNFKKIARRQRIKGQTILIGLSPSFQTNSLPSPKCKTMSWDYEVIFWPSLSTINFIFAFDHWQIWWLGPSHTSKFFAYWGNVSIILFFPYSSFLSLLFLWHLSSPLECMIAFVTIVTLVSCPVTGKQKEEIDTY